MPQWLVLGNWCPKNIHLINNSEAKISPGLHCNWFVFYCVCTILSTDQTVVNECEVTEGGVEEESGTGPNIKFELKLEVLFRAIPQINFFK